jgi:hypothetical protein
MKKIHLNIASLVKGYRGRGGASKLACRRMLPRTSLPPYARLSPRPSLLNAYRTFATEEKAPEQVNRGPTPRRSRIKFTPETIARRVRAAGLNAMYAYWDQYFKEQRRVELAEREIWQRTVEERRAARAAERQRIVQQRQEELKEIENKIKEQKAKLHQLAAELSMKRHEIKEAAKREWLEMLEEDSDLWEKTPEELKNRKYAQGTPPVFYDGYN